MLYVNGVVFLFHLIYLLRSWLGELISTTEVPPLVFVRQCSSALLRQHLRQIEGFLGLPPICWAWTTKGFRQRQRVSKRRKKQIGRWIFHFVDAHPVLGKKPQGFPWSMDSTVTSKVFHPPVNAIGELPHTWDVTYRSSSLRPILPAQQKSAVFLLRPWFSRNDHCCISPSRSGLQFRGEPTFYYPAKFSGLEPWKWGGGGKPKSQPSSVLQQQKPMIHVDRGFWFLVVGFAS